MTRTLRKTVQLICLALFLLLVLPPLPVEFARTLLHRIVPFTAVSSAFSPSLSPQIILAFSATLLLLLLTAFFGRFFCGWICPLGTVIELTGSALSRLSGAARRPRPTRKPKFLIVVFLLAAFPFALNLLWTLDPVSTFSRALAVLTSVGVVHPISFILLLALLIIVLLSFLAPRFWCRVVCPLGALLGIIAKIRAPARIIATERCIDCARCDKACPAGLSRTAFEISECIQCRSCADACPRDAISFSRTPPPDSAASPQPARTALSRRSVLAAALCGAATGLAFRLLRTEHPHSPLRPPGSIEDDAFRATCIRCGACLKACPTGGLQPLLLEGGITALLTPVLVPRIGACEFGCTACGEVCPSGAIRRIKPEEKANIQIGLAVIDREKCLPWAKGVQCLVCHDLCVYKAIELRLVNGGYKPYVKEWVCTGCGICENRCPTQPEPAIVVISTR